MLDELQEQKEAAQARLEQAVGEGGLTLDEYTDRVATVWAATSTGQLEAPRTGLGRDIQVTSNRVPGSPRLRLRASTVSGDVKVRTKS